MPSNPRQCRLSQGLHWGNCGSWVIALACVSRVYTDLAVLDIGSRGVQVLEMTPGLDFETLQACTGLALIRPR